MRTWSFELAKRDAPLSSNRRVHWAKQRAVARDLRWQARTLTIEAIGHGHGLTAVDLVLRITPPDARTRDSDNYVAHLLKPIKDGVAAALRFEDDSDARIRWMLVLTGPTGERRWRYVVEITERS